MGDHFNFFQIWDTSHCVAEVRQNQITSILCGSELEGFGYYKGKQLEYCRVS